ncbi:MAG: Gfo/Idh/MocA family oxidoreductase [Clostridium lundense]|nr:Gfo/Idh/MocA family oxidoreductase [Clostridium lundense]
MIKVGILGCGSITKFRHAPEYANNQQVEIAAFYDTNKNRAEELASIYGGKVAETYEEIFNDPEITAISNCLPNNLHYKTTIEALKSGKHVLCEKPMTGDLNEAKEMVKVSESTGKILMVDHNQRFAEAHKKANEILKSGELGRVLTFHTVFGHKGPEYWSENKTKGTWFFNKEQSILGVAGDLGIHKIDLIRYILEDEIEYVTAMEGTLDKKDENGDLVKVSDNMICTLKTKTGIIGNATFSWTYYGEEKNYTMLFCEKGIMRIYDNPEYDLIIEKLNGEKVFYKVGKLQTNDNQTSTGIIDEFIEAIIQNRKSLITGQDGLEALKVILAAIESASSYKTIYI